MYILVILAHIYPCIDIAPYTGEEGNPIYIAIRGHVFDVSIAKNFYGPGSGYRWKYI